MDDNTFECPNCGARIYPEMTRCPQCGQNMYPEDEETATEINQAGGINWGLILGAVLIGWMIASGIGLLVHFLVARFVSPPALGGFSEAVLFMAGPVGALAGGYICAGMIRMQSKSFGGLVGVLALPVLILLATHWVRVTPALLVSPTILSTGILTILAGVGGAWLNQKFIQDTGWQENWKIRGWEDMLYQDLLRKTRFNGAIADRLIEYERKQEPEASRLKLIQNAIERWEKDNR